MIFPILIQPSETSFVFLLNFELLNEDIMLTEHSTLSVGLLVFHGHFHPEQICLTNYTSLTKEANLTLQCASE